MVISPCLNATYILLEGYFEIFNLIKISIFYLDLLQQTLDMHPNSNIIHIGCDEVILTNSHPSMS